MIGGAAAQETPVPERSAQILLAARNDIEILANNTLGAAERPVGWNGTFDVNDPQMALKARLDLELLAEVLTAGRPPGWFGVQPTSAYATARDIRHDLELLADAVVAPNVRPPNWQGDDPILRCNRATQTLALLLAGQHTAAAVPGSPTYCADLEIQLSVFVETTLLDAAPRRAPSPIPSPPTDVPAPDANTPVSVVSPDTLVYYDRGASQVAGTIPQGTALTPIARSYAQFSRMTLVRGNGFEVFIDYQDTTLDAAMFEALGDVGVLDVTPICELEWCQPAN